MEWFQGAGEMGGFPRLLHRMAVSDTEHYATLDMLGNYEVWAPNSTTYA
jgi:hypothetical protein